MKLDDCKLTVEKVWLATSLIVFLLHLLIGADLPFNKMWGLEAVMVVLTFPFGPLVMFLLAIADELSGGHTVIGWLIDWSTLLVVGYLQWFWVLPQIRRNSRLITLNLSSPVEPASPAVPPSRVETALPAVPLSTPAPPDNSSTPPQLAAPALSPALPPAPPTATPPVVFNVADFLPPFAEFDEAGLTALDRVLRAANSAPPAATPAASPVHVE